MSLNGDAFTFLPYTLNGINNVATAGDISSCVKYSGNTANTNLDGYDLTTTGTLGAQYLALPASLSNIQSWVMYALSTNTSTFAGSSLGGFITQELTSGAAMYFDTLAVGAPNFQFSNFAVSTGKVLVTDANRMMSTTINASQLNYITALSSQAGGIDQTNTWSQTQTFSTLLISTMATTAFQGVNFSTLTATVGSYVPYSGATQNLVMPSSTIQGLLQTSSLRVNGSNNFSVYVNSTVNALQIENLVSNEKTWFNGGSINLPSNVYVGNTVLSNDLQLSGTSYFSYGSAQQWGTTLNSSAEYEIQDVNTSSFLRLSKTTGLTVSTLALTATPTSTVTEYLGLNGTRVVKFTPAGGGTVTTSTATARFIPYMSTTSVLTNSLLNQIDNDSIGLGFTTLPSYPYAGGKNMYLNGSLFTNGVVAPSISTISIAPSSGSTISTIANLAQPSNNDVALGGNTFLLNLQPTATAILQTAGLSSQAAAAGVISGSYTLTPSPTTAAFACCYSPSQTFLTTKYGFEFTGFSASVFGISLTIFQANVGNTARVAISPTVAVGSGTFTGTFNPNSNVSFLGQVFLEFSGTANKTMSWTAFTYRDGEITMNGGATVNGNLIVSGPVSVGNRLLGSANAPTENFWLGLRGSGTEAQRLAIGLVGDATTGVVSNITVQKPFYIGAGTEFRRIGGNSGANWASIRGEDPNNSPYLEFWVSNSRRCYIGYATTTNMNIMAETGAKLQLGTESVYAMTIDTNRYIGVGTVSPGYKLHVAGGDGNIRAEGAVYCDNFFSVNNARQIVLNDANAVNWITNNTGTKPISFGPGTWANNGYTVISQPQSVNGVGLGFGNSSHPGNTGGRSVILSLAPSVAWGEIILSGGIIYTSCFGTVNLYTNGGGWVFVSDKRCKKDIKDIKTARSLQRIMALKPKTYKKIYKENAELSTPVPQEVRDADHIGFLAQDVMESNPHCVSEWNDDTDGKRLAISYADINIHMVGAVQELKKQNDAQQKEIEELRAMVQALSERLNAK